MNQLQSNQLGMLIHNSQLDSEFMHSQHQLFADGNNPNSIIIQSPSQVYLESPKISSHNFQTQRISLIKQKKKQERYSIREILKNPEKQTDNMLYKMKLRKYLKNYVENLKNYTLQRGIEKLKQVHHHLINDCTDKVNINENQEIKNFKTKKLRSMPTKTFNMIQKVEKFNSLKARLLRFPVIKQTSAFFLYWNCIVLMCILYNFYAIPLRVVYKDIFLRQECSLQGFIYFQTIIFLLDILLIFNTSIIINDRIITDRREILYTQIKSRRLLIDFLSLMGFVAISFPLYYDCEGNFSVIQQILSILFYLKYSKISKLYNKVERQITIKQTYITSIKLIRLMINFLMIAHYVACLWILTGLQGQKNGIDNWLDKFDLSSSAWYRQYFAAIYFSLMTMTTVGYGDISPQNDIERIVDASMMVINQFKLNVNNDQVLACAAFGFIINKIASIVDELENKKIQYHRELTILNTYMDKLNINQELRVRVRNYFKMFWKTNLIQQFDKEAEVINKLCKSLKEELVIDHLGEILKQIPIMHNTFSETFLQQLSLKMRQFVLTPDETILISDVKLIKICQFQDQQQVEDKLIFIGQGSASIHYKFNKQVFQLGNLEPGDYYGIYNIFQLNDCENKHINIKANQFTVVYELYKSEFLNLLQEFPDDYEKYCQIRDNFVYSSQLQKKLQGNCLICGTDQHMYDQCTIVHFSPNPRYVLYKNQFSVPVQRSPCQRRIHSLVKNIFVHKNQKGKISSLKNIIFFQTSVVNFQNNLTMNSSYDDSFEMNQDLQIGINDLKSVSNDGFVHQTSLKDNDTNSEVSPKKMVDKEKEEIKISGSGFSQIQIEPAPYMSCLNVNEKRNIRFNEISSAAPSKKKLQQQTSPQSQQQQAVQQIIPQSPCAIQMLDLDNIYQGTIYQPSHQIAVILAQLNQRKEKEKRNKKRRFTSKVRT